MAICEGDTDVITEFLPKSLESGIFEALEKEVQWERMSHQGGEVPRLVAVQGSVNDDGSMPIYRHPADESPPLLPFTPTVIHIKEITERALGHSLNHVLIQYYRDGTDYISEHSDKTLDIVNGSYIANVSLGAQRTMTLRTKRARKDANQERGSATITGTARQIQRVELPHNSLFKMGLQTNMKWLHSIRQDKRAERDKTEPELAFNGARISLTFRHIGTFMDEDQYSIWGQGATGKSRQAAQPIVNGQSEEAIRMLRAFGTENNTSQFDWEHYYGSGFNVLNIKTAPRLFMSDDNLANMRIKMMLLEYGINYSRGRADWPKGEKTISAFGQRALAFVRYLDNDASRTDVRGDIAVMLYLYFNHISKCKQANDEDTGQLFAQFYRAMSLLDIWEATKPHGQNAVEKSLLEDDLQYWEKALDGRDFLAGESVGLPDFAIWPVLHDITEHTNGSGLNSFSRLKAYYERILSLDGIKKNVSIVEVVAA